MRRVLLWSSSRLADVCYFVVYSYQLETRVTTEALYRDTGERMNDVSEICIRIGMALA